jgi:cytochrome c556
VNKKQAIAAACVVTLAAAGAAALAQQKPKDAIKYRQSALFIVGQNFGPIAAMVQGKIPYDKDDAARRAAIVDFVIKLPWPAFAPGTEEGDTKAKPEIWLDMDDFKAKAKDVQEEAAKLAQVAATGDFDALKTQVGATGKACKACHDKYRNK